MVESSVAFADFAEKYDFLAPWSVYATVTTTQANTICSKMSFNNRIIDLVGRLLLVVCRCDAQVEHVLVGSIRYRCLMVYVFVGDEFFVVQDQRKEEVVEGQT